MKFFYFYFSIALVVYNVVQPEMMQFSEETDLTKRFRGTSGTDL